MSKDDWDTIKNYTPKLWNQISNKPIIKTSPFLLKDITSSMSREKALIDSNAKKVSIPTDS